MSRGRKEGSVSGKRPIFWVCVGFSDNIIVEKIYSTNNSSDDDIRSFSSKEAAKIFKEKYNVEPCEVVGPCYDVKSLTKLNSYTSVLKSENDKMSDSTNISCILGSGFYNGWSGTVFEISGKKDEVLFIASDRLDCNSNKILPPAMPIKKELIQFA